LVLPSSYFLSRDGAWAARSGLDRVHEGSRGHIVFGRRLDARYADLRERLQAGARETMLWILGLVGGGLLVWSIVEYIALFVLRPR
jgi:hypothetical protein